MIGSNLVIQKDVYWYNPGNSYSTITFDQLKELYGIFNISAGNATAYAFMAIYFNNIIGNTIQVMCSRAGSTAPGAGYVSGIGI